MTTNFNIFDKLENFASLPGDFDWVRHYKDVFEFVKPPYKVNTAGFEDGLKDIIPDKLSECLNRQQQLQNEQRERAKIIDKLPEKDKWYWEEWDTIWFSEFVYINKWLKYWNTLYQKVSNDYKEAYTFNDSISDEDVEKAKEYLIEDLYPGELKKSGSRLIGKCPFHEEKTGSFFIFPENTWYCFGACKEGGDVISFYQKLNDYDFLEAVKYLRK